MIFTILSIIYIVFFINAVVFFCLVLLTFNVRKIKKQRKFFVIVFIFSIIISLLSIIINIVGHGPPQDIKVRGKVTVMNIRCKWEKPVTNGEFDEYAVQTPALYGLNFSPSLMLIAKEKSYIIEGFMYRYDTVTVCINNKSQQIPSITVTSYKSIK